MRFIAVVNSIVDMTDPVAQEPDVCNSRCGQVPADLAPPWEGIATSSEFGGIMQVSGGGSSDCCALTARGCGGQTARCGSEQLDQTWRARVGHHPAQHKKFHL